jgi:hypothetical protein
MEEEFEKLGKRMAEALRTIDEVRGKLSGAVIKYLLRNSSDLDRCTEQAISKAFNIPRSTTRRILGELSEERILQTYEYKQMRPYTVALILAPLDKNLLAFGHQEFLEIFGVQEAAPEDAPPNYDLGLGIEKEKGREVAYYLNIGHRDLQKLLIGRFQSFRGSSGLDIQLDREGEVRAEAVSKALRDHVFPARCGRNMPSYGLFMPVAAIDPLTAWGLELFNKLLKEEKEPSKDRIVREYRETALRNMEMLMDSQLKWLEALLEEKGSEETTKFLEQRGAYWSVEDGVRNRFNPECVWAMELCLAEGVSILKALGVDKEDCERLLGRIRAVGTAFER